MEKRLNTKLDTYVSSFKTDVCAKIKDIGFNDSMKVSEILEFIYDYNKLCMTTDDFIKRKRIKNTIPITNRCIAKRANNEQCTRRRKDAGEFCGTHSKGIPHGLINSDTSIEHTNKVEVYAVDISGITYYVDNTNNIYDTEDIMNGIQNPRIISEYVITNGCYKILKTHH
jgi:hypothetical protein